MSKNVFLITAFNLMPVRIICHNDVEKTTCSRFLFIPCLSCLKVISAKVIAAMVDQTISGTHFVYFNILL